MFFFSKENLFSRSVLLRASMASMEVLSSTDIHAKELLSSQEFLFATPDEIVQGRLTTVDTVDSVSKGIKITMYDWGDERGLDSHRQNWDGNNPPIQDRLPFMQGIMGATNSYADKYESGKVKPGILANYIDKENGQTAPNILNENGTGNGHNLSELFSDSYIRTGTTAEKVNHLFLQSVYDDLRTMLICRKVMILPFMSKSGLRVTELRTLHPLI